MSGPDGELADRGKFIEIWRLVDGEWKITNDIFNSDLPAQADDSGEGEGEGEEQSAAS